MALQRCGLFFQSFIGQAALDIINAAPLGRRQTGDIGAGFFRRLRTIKISQPANRQVVAAIHPQGALIIALRCGIIFARCRHISEPEHRIAIGTVDSLSLRIIVLRPIQLSGLQRGIALFDQQPVAVRLEQAVPFIAIRAFRIHRDRFVQLCDGTGSVATLRIGLAQGAHGIAVPGIGPYGLLYIGHGLGGVVIFNRRQPFRTHAKRRILQLSLLLSQQHAGIRCRFTGCKQGQETLQFLHAGPADRHIFDFAEPHIGGSAATGGRTRHLF